MSVVIKCVVQLNTVSYSDVHKLSVISLSNCDGWVSFFWTESCENTDYIVYINHNSDFVDMPKLFEFLYCLLNYPAVTCSLFILFTNTTVSLKISLF